MRFDDEDGSPYEGMYYSYLFVDFLSSWYCDAGGAPDDAIVELFFRVLDNTETYHITNIYNYEVSHNGRPIIGNVTITDDIYASYNEYVFVSFDAYDEDIDRWECQQSDACSTQDMEDGSVYANGTLLFEMTRITLETDRYFTFYFNVTHTSFTRWENISFVVWDGFAEEWNQTHRWYNTSYCIQWSSGGGGGDGQRVPPSTTIATKTVDFLLFPICFVFLKDIFFKRRK